MKWEILNKDTTKNTSDIIKKLLENRNLKTKKEIDDFLNPKDPEKINLTDLGIKKENITNVLKRLEKAKKNKEKIVIFGDYDADGVCATAILWEALYKLGFDAMPYIPDRFEEGYGIKKESFEKEKLKSLNPNLIITVDNGIVAHEGIKEAKRLGIDVIVVDHHAKGTKKIDTRYVIHSTLVCGSALSWFLSKELKINDGLDLVALGTIADQMPLLGINRSIAKFGLESLTKTKRMGLRLLFKDLKINNIGVYEVGYLIAPRINAMGRLASATDSLRFLCTRDIKKAEGLKDLLNQTNIERQKIVDKVIAQTLEKVTSDKVIVISGDYHEGVIGLASGRITEKFYRPSIVLSEGKEISKASARSISGFNIIETIKETGLILEGGGHPMAAGFSIETKRVEEFKLKVNELANNKLTDEVLERKLKIDTEIDFKNITKELVQELKKFEPIGQGSYSPVFMTKKIKIVEVKTVGTEGKHLKLKLEKDGIKFDAIWFEFKGSVLKKNKEINVAYNIEENAWNSNVSIQLRVKDVK